MDVIPGILPDALLKRLYIWRTVVEKGVIVTNGSDSPCSTMNPFESMHTAVTRLSERGTNTFEEKPYKEALTRLQPLGRIQRQRRTVCLKRRNWGLWNAGSWQISW